MWDARGALPAVCLAALATVPLWWIMGRAKRANSDVVDEQEQAAKRSRGTAAAPGLHVLSYAWKPDNVFAGIQSGSIPAEKVFDVEHTFAILDHSPVSRGHCLVITKHPVSTLCQGLPAEALAATLRDVQVLTKAVQAAVGAAGVQVMQNNGPAAGQTVPQLHFHVVPVEAPVLAPQQQQQQQQAERPTLTPEESGPLLASIRNALPADYSGGGCHAWIPSAAAMEDLGASLLSLCIPGTVVCLSGHLGTGKSSIARGTVRAFCGDPDLFVPSPTFLLNLSYTADTAHEAQPEAAAAQLPYAAVQSVHHMDPYRLGNADKMAGLIDFAAAFQEDICLIEWPERMPASVLALPRRRTLQVRISGSGAQAAGRLVHIWCSDEPCGGSSGSSGGGVGPASKTAAGRGAGGAGKGGGPRGPVVAAAAATEVRPEAATAAAPVAVAGAANSDAGQQEGPAQDAGHADVHAVLQQWRQSGIPPPSVTWRAASTTAAEAAAGGNGTSVPGPGALSSSRGGQQVVLEGPPESWVVLGIESSCDDTAAAVVRGDGQVLAHKIASQTGLHEQYGGVKPDVARDAHAAAITSTVDAALQEAGVTPQQLTAVAVTVGPGLSLCLQVGVRHALSIAAAARKPIVPVHHMEAHALVTRMPGVVEPPMQFPALLLLVSGGHNMLVRCEGLGRHRILGTTIDDSVGEAFDKTARLLGISAIPGGPQLEALAATADEAGRVAFKGRVALPLRQDRDSCNFSFSGVKTSVAALIDKELPKGQQQQQEEEEEEGAGAQEAAAEQLQKVRAAIAWQFQETCVRFLTERTRRALARCAADQQQLGMAPLTCLVVAGGVAANKAVRAGLDAVAAEFGLPCVYPPVKYCTDNGLMVAWTGVERLKAGLARPPPAPEEVEGSVEVLPRWPLGPVDVRGMARRTQEHVKLLH